MSLALLSTLVGMVCPGLHSVFSGFRIDILDSSVRGLLWRTIGVDRRFGSVTMFVRGAGFEGEVQAFERPKPIAPPSMAEISGLVASNEFAGRTALVVGGSRGLGAVTAKLLAAGGARVLVTYARGQEETEMLVADIRAAGKNAGALHLDVTREVVTQLEGPISLTTHLYYFATPRIDAQRAKVFARGNFDIYLLYYVHAFEEIIRCLASKEGSKLQAAFYPSTVYLEDRPKGLTEYAMAKAAGEILSRDLAQALGVRMSTPRISRTLTDQTASLISGGVADAVSVLLPLLRAEDSAR